MVAFLRFREESYQWTDTKFLKEIGLARHVKPGGLDAPCSTF